MWKREDGVGTQPMPSWAMYAEAMNKFTRPAIAFIEQVHLLTEARTAYQEAMVVGTDLRNRLEAGDKTLRDLMTQLEQVVSAFGLADLIVPLRLSRTKTMTQDYGEVESDDE